MAKKHSQSPEENDIVIEEEFTEDSHAGDAYQAKIDKLKEKLRTCEASKEEYLLGWQRSQADFINFKKNNASVFVDAKKASLSEFVESILPVLDSLEMALTGEFDDTFKKWLTGFEYIKQQFSKILEEHGVQQMNVLGHDFEPSLHEAIDEVMTDKKEEDGKIAQVVLKGYKTSERIIRAPQVKVYKYQK